MFCRDGFHFYFIKVTLYMVTLNKDTKSTDIRCMKKPKYEKMEMLISVEIGWVKYLGEFYM